VPGRRQSAKWADWGFGGLDLERLQRATVSGDKYALAAQCCDAATHFYPKIVRPFALWSKINGAPGLLQDSDPGASGFHSSASGLALGWGKNPVFAGLKREPF